jgi:hypothetical protein
MATRNLQVDIDGDPSGFDRACSDAADAARTFDRELARLERAQRDQERAASSASRATHDYGSAMGEAEVASRRAGLAAKEAGDRAKRAQDQAATAAERATVAQKNAADAAEALGRGEITAAEAAKAQARALGEVARAEGLAEVASRQLERANIAQALAARAAGKAENDLADQERQAARAAVLAAGVQQLAHLRAAGSIREHNLLLRRLRNDYGDLGRGAREMSTLAQRAFGLVGRSGTSAVDSVSKGMTSLADASPMMVAGVVAALFALPAIAVGVGALTTLGLGAGLAGLGVMAAAKTKPVKDAFSSMKKHISAEASTLGKPFVPVLEHIAFLGQKTFDSFMPALKGAEAEMAPAVSHFADGFAQGMQRFGPTITKVADEFTPLLSALGDQMPAILGNVADGIDSVVQAAAGHEDAIAGFVTDLSKIVSVSGDAVEGLSHVFDATKYFAHMPTDPWSFVKDAVPPLNVAAGLFGVIKDRADPPKGWDTAAGDFGSAATSAGTLGAKVMTIHTAAQLAAMSAADLKAQLDSLTGKELSARDAAATYAESIFAMNKSLHDNGAAHGYATEKGVANEKNLTSMAKAANANAIAMRDDGQSANVVAKAMETARQRIVTAAEKMGYSRSEAEKLATKLLAVRDAANKIPSGKTLKLHVDTAAALAAIAKMRQNAGQPLPAAHFAASGGYIGHANGGPVRHYATAGAVTGPGTGTSDSIPAMLSNGEYVVNAAATARNRKTLDAMNWGKASMPEWGKASSDPFVKSSINTATSFSRAPAEVASKQNPSWWHGQASTAFGPGMANFAWGSARPDVAAAATTAAKAPPPPTFVKASMPPPTWGKASIAPSKLQVEWVGGATAGGDFMSWLRNSIKIGGGDVQTVLGKSS